MASDERRPGLAAGLVAILEDAFGVAATPVAERSKVAEAVRRTAAEQGISCGALWLSDAPLQRASNPSVAAFFNSAGRSVIHPEPTDEKYARCFVALVDPEPDLKWGHDAFFAFIPANAEGPVRFVPTQLPARADGVVRLLPVPPAGASR